jgi:glutathione S-transferase
MRGMKTDEEQVAALIANLEAKLAGYEVILSKHKYLAGDDITLADLFHLPAGARLADAGVTLLQDTAKFPHVAR